MSPAELLAQVPRDMKGVAKRLFCDAYMYLYQSTSMCLYRWGKPPRQQSPVHIRKANTVCFICCFLKKQYLAWLSFNNAVLLNWHQSCSSFCTVRTWKWQSLNDMLQWNIIFFVYFLLMFDYNLWELLFTFSMFIMLKMCWISQDFLNEWCKKKVFFLLMLSHPKKHGGRCSKIWQVYFHLQRLHSLSLNCHCFAEVSFLH